MSTKIKIKGLDVSDRGRARYSLKLTAPLLQKMLDANFAFINPKYNWKKHTGVQRDPEDTAQRGEEISQYIQGGYSIDNGLRWNIDPPTKISVTPLSDKDFVEIEFDSDTNINLIEARHRFIGFDMAVTAYIEDGEVPPNLCIPVILTNDDQTQQLISFAVDNLTAKTPRKTLLAWQKSDLKKKLTPEKFKLLPRKLRAACNKIVEAVEVVEMLHTRNTGKFKNNVFVGRIEMPNESPTNKIISGSMLAEEHVRKAFASRRGHFPLEPEKVALVFVNWFAAWSEVVPQPFNQEAYGLFRPHHGSETLCYVLDKLMEARFAGKVPSINDFKEYVQNSGKYGTERYWNSSNTVGFLKEIHGKGHASSISTKILMEMGIVVKV